MMKINIYVGGRDRRDWAAEGISHFIQLLRPFANISIDIFSPEQGSEPKDTESLFNRVPAGIPIVLLDHSGATKNSIEFARLVKDLSGHSGKLAFFIGGPEGFSKGIIDQAKNVISLSPMTFSHRLALIIFLEQLYRAFDISSKGKYQR